MSTKHNEGDWVIEFFPFSQDEVDSLIAQQEETYMNSGHSLENLKGDLAANVNLKIGPVVKTLPVLLELHEQGYVLRTDRYCGTDRAGYLDVTLRKPSAMLQEEVRTIHAKALEQYEEQRYQRNKAETERQLAITLERQAREAAAKAELAEAKRLEKAKEQALKDLREAYSE